MEDLTFHVIAHMRSDFASKFGIPRQSGLVPELESTIVFEPAYRDANAVRGIEEFSHIWLIWQFSEASRDTWSPTVKPPRLGGNVRMGVFATRSPFRPNAIGLSCVELRSVEYHPELGPILHVGGADLMNGTPILDIKPYVAYADCVPDAALGFTTRNGEYTLNVNIPDHLLCLIPEEKRAGLTGVLEQDPRPQYQHDPNRVYGVTFGKQNIRFRVQDRNLTVLEITPVVD